MQLFSVKGVLDTEAGPNIIHVKHLPPHRRKFPLPYEVRSWLLDASNNPIQLIVIIPFHLGMGKMLAKVQFLVDKKLATSCILGKSFIDQFVKAIIPASSKVVLYDSPSVAILSVAYGGKVVDRPEAKEYTKV